MRSQIINDGKELMEEILMKLEKYRLPQILPKSSWFCIISKRLNKVLSTTTLGTPSDAQKWMILIQVLKNLFASL